MSSLNARTTYHVRVLASIVSMRMFKQRITAPCSGSVIQRMSLVDFLFSVLATIESLWYVVASAKETSEEALVLSRYSCVIPVDLKEGFRLIFFKRSDYCTSIFQLNSRPPTILVDLHCNLLPHKCYKTSPIHNLWLCDPSG